MNRKSEKWLERKLVEYVTAQGGTAIKLTASTTTNGLPDRLILWPGGEAEFAELKSTGKKQTAVQREVFRKLVQMGFICTLIDDFKSLLEWQQYSHPAPTKAK